MQDFGLSSFVILLKENEMRKGAGETRAKAVDIAGAASRAYQKRLGKIAFFRRRLSKGVGQTQVRTRLADFQKTRSVRHARQ
jgi:hypothetical protein